MTEQQIKQKIIEKSDVIAKAISKGKDIEIRKSACGITIAEVSKRVIAR